MSLCHIHGGHLFITFWRKEMASSNTNHSNFWYKERNRTLKLTNVTGDFWAGKPEIIWLKVWNRGICVVFSSRVLQGAMVRVTLMNGVGFSSAPQVKCLITEKITKMAISSETSLIVYFSISLCLVAEKTNIEMGYFLWLFTYQNAN